MLSEAVCCNQPGIRLLETQVMTRIVYIGVASGTSLHRARALERLGYSVTVVDPWSWLTKLPLQARAHFHTRYLGVDSIVARPLYARVRAAAPDLIWVNDGEFLGRGSLGRLRELRTPMVNYSADNPFVVAANGKWRNFLANVDMYDVVAQTFAKAAARLEQFGARRVLRVFLSADEVAHRSGPVSQEDVVQYGSSVSYVAQWSPERGPFILRLSELGVPITLWGNRWRRAKEWPRIRHLWRGPGVSSTGYRKIIQLSKISLCLLHKAAGNLHTSRSIEIPAIGTVLCAERSTEHRQLYTEGAEAVFFDSAEECAEQCKALLANEGLRRRIARGGHERAVRNNLFNEPVLASILSPLLRDGSISFMNAG